MLEISRKNKFKSLDFFPRSICWCFHHQVGKQYLIIKSNDSINGQRQHYPITFSKQSLQHAFNHKLVEQLIECIDSLSRITNYCPWQNSYDWFGYNCWYYVFDPTALPDPEKDTLGSDYNLENAQQYVDEMRQLSNAINGWVVYDQPSGPRYISIDDWQLMYDKNCEQMKLPRIYNLL